MKVADDKAQYTDPDQVVEFVEKTKCDSLAIAVGTSLSAQIILLFGMAEAISGVVLKNWTIKIAGFLTGIGGLALYYGIGLSEEQMFLFTFAGVVLAATGLIVKHQYK